MQLQLPFTLVTGISPDGLATGEILRDVPLKPGAAPADPGPRLPEARPPVEFVRVRRARRYILRVRSDGTLRVTVPRGGSRREAEAFVSQHRTWIDRERRRVAAEHAPRDWKAGDSVLLRGVPVRLNVVQEAAGHVVAWGDRRIAIPPDAPSLRDVIEEDLRQLAEAELVPRLHALAARHGLTVRQVSIRNQRSRWGSCAHNGNIALNFRLMQMPPEICEYVLVHELMHLRQQNHSRRFWRHVQAVCPGFREAERWLRTHGRRLF